MKKKLYLFGLLLMPILLCTFACQGPSAPTSPAPGAPTKTATATSTPTSTGTISPTATPPCVGVPDVTANINGADYDGNDTGKTFSPSLLGLDQGGTSAGDILTFALTTSMTLNFSLCPTEEIGRAMMMYIRPICTNPTGETFNGGYCTGMAEITGLTLSPGTYAIILPEAPGSSVGPYVLRIISGTLSSTVCGPSNGVVPEAIPPGEFGDCSTIYEMNGTGHNGTFGAPFSGIRAVTGELDESANIANTDDFVSFTPTNSGPVSVTMDCFDNGLGANDFDVFCAAICPDGTIPPYVGLSDGIGPTEQFTFVGTAGTTYYLDVQAYQGVGPYRVTVQTP